MSTLLFIHIYDANDKSTFVSRSIPEHTVTAESLLAIAKSVARHNPNVRSIYVEASVGFTTHNYRKGFDRYTSIGYSVKTQGGGYNYIITTTEAKLTSAHKTTFNATSHKREVVGVRKLLWRL